MKRWEVTSKEGRLSLLSFLKTKFGDTYSSRQLKRAIEGNLCTVNNVTERVASKPLKFGDRVIFFSENISLLPKRPTQVEKKRILYEDDVFLSTTSPQEPPQMGKV